MSYLLTFRRDLLNQPLRLELPPEIRFDPIGCPPEAIDEANAAEKRSGERAFEPVEVAVERIRTELDPSLTQLKSWAQHPDERVVIALLSSNIIRSFTKVAKHIMPYIVPRAIRDAQNRGEVWTPLLDALSSSIWRGTLRSLSVDKQLVHEQRYLETVVGPWIQRQTNPDVLRSMVVRTKSAQLIMYIAETATVFDRALLDSVLGVCPGAAIEFAKNDHLPPELQQYLLDHLVIATTHRKDDPAMGKHLADAYHFLGERGLRFQSSHIARLVELFEHHVAQSDDPHQQVCQRVLRLLDLYINETGDEEVALRAIEMAGKMKDSYWAVALLRDWYFGHSRHDNAPALARAALVHCGRFAKVLDVLAEHPRVRNDSDVRPKLLESRRPEVLLELARDGRSEEFPLLFKQIAPIYPEVAFGLLNRLREIACQTLSPTDLLPLLQHSSPEVRLGAFAFLGKLQEEPKISAPVPQRRLP